MATDMIQARALLGFAELLSDVNADPMPLLDCAKIPREALHEPERPISLDALARLYDLTAGQLGMADFGLRLSTYQDASLYGPLALIALNAHSVGEALDGLTRNFAYHTPGAHFDVGPSDDGRWLGVQYRLRLSANIDGRQIIEQSYAMAFKLWSMVAPQRVQEAHIILRHAPVLPLATYANYFGCPLSFDQPQDAILLPLDALATPLAQTDDSLRATAERYVAHIIRRHPLDVGRQVEQLIDQQLAVGGARIDAIARQLGLHRRTLQRRLAEQSLVFDQLLDQRRQAHARRYLADDQLSLARVTTLLGYNEQSSFIRACKRWSGLAPGPWRRQLMAASIGSDQ
ncbi:AraC family transcriptional regulator [Saccharospirillum mangrovi]|uniref:AraC family transcriptional regulator n=1 Tax=Saccharospirillum mangrovi TaxID=2161747 RepID=UPI000D3A73D3|nr:AraC family transcriptional regulator [Saccharospirillum mangrovi]